MSDRMPQKNLMISKEKQKNFIKEEYERKITGKRKNNCSNPTTQGRE